MQAIGQKKASSTTHFFKKKKRIKKLKEASEVSDIINPKKNILVNFYFSKELLLPFTYPLLSFFLHFLLVLFKLSDPPTLLMFLE